MISISTQRNYSASWILYIFMLCCLISGIPYSYAAFGTITESNSEASIKARIKPIGSCSVEGTPAPSSIPAPPPQDLGKYRYERSCKVCHGPGIASAPKLKTAADWKPRMKIGIAGLLTSAIKGKGAMPPKGTCMSCSDDELKAAIEYMLPS